jgi:hypothetical protein
MAGFETFTYRWDEKASLMTPTIEPVCIASRIAGAPGTHLPIGDIDGSGRSSPVRSRRNQIDMEVARVFESPPPLERLQTDAEVVARQELLAE